MSKNYLTEAFKEMELLEESKSFSLDKQGAEDLSKFLEDDTLDDFEVVIDPEVTNKDELQDSYIGKIILGCDVCHSMIYKAPEDIIIDEESQMANVGELCPYCFTGDGYKIVGKVVPYQEVTVETPSNDADVKVKVDGKDIDTEIKEDDLDESIEADQKYPVKVEKAPAMNESISKFLKKEKEAEEESLDEEIQADQKYPVKSPISENVDDDEGKLEEDLTNMEKIMRAFPEINFDAPVTEGTSNKDGFALNDVDGEIVIFEDSEEKEKYPSREAAEEAGCDLEAMEEIIDEALTADQKYPVKSPITESMEDISITTEDTVIKVKATPRTDKEMIEPITEEEVAEMQSTESTTVDEEDSIEEIESDEEVEMDEIDEEGVDELGESYLKQVYENVNSFKTSKATLKKDKMIIEGVITFNSGKKAKTQFLFEAKEMTRKGKLKFLGENKNLSKNKKAFTLTGLMEGKKLMVESLNYNYSGIDSKTGKAKRLYGTVKVSR